MTRFNELKRINRAIKYRDLSELRWAQGYIQMRLNISSMKHHSKHWEKLLKDVEVSMRELNKKD